MNKKESFEPGMDSEDEENELDPLRDLNDELHKIGEKLDHANRVDPTTDWSPNGGYESAKNSRTSERSSVKLPKDSLASGFPSDNFSGEQPLKKVGSRSLIRQLISKLFPSRR